MGLNYFTMPGEILKEYIESRNINQKELAHKVSSSERHISEVVNGKARITEEFALKLESVFKDTKAEFWLELENKYRLYLLRSQIDTNINVKEIVEKYKLDYVYKGLKYDYNKMVKEYFDLVGVESVDALEKTMTSLSNVNFMHDKEADKGAIFTWLKLCEEQIEIQNNLDTFPKYDHNNLIANQAIIKKLLNTTNYSLALKKVKRILNDIGIGLVFEEAVPNAKVRGATTLYQDQPMIYLTTRYKRIDSIYFALIHEIIHLINKDYEKEVYSLSSDVEENELLTNEKTREFFVERAKYDDFIKNKEFNEEELIIFAQKNGIVVDIVLGFLQRDGEVEYNQLQHLRTYVKLEALNDVYFNT